MSQASFSDTMIGVLIVMAAAIAGADCSGKNKLPTAPDIGAAAINLEPGTAMATKSVAIEGPFTYNVSLRVRETGGVAATISQVTVTVTNVSGATVETPIPPADAFGTTRIQAHGTLTSTGIVVMGPLAMASELNVRVWFLDDHGNTGSAHASTAVRAEFTSEWSGPTTITQPPGDWSVIRVSLAQRGDELSGEVITRDGRRFPVTGCVSCEWAPWLSVGGLPTHSGGCSIGFIVRDFEFSSGRMQKMTARLTGRCPGTASGTADLRRSS